MRNSKIFVCCFATLGMSAFGFSQSMIDVAFGNGSETPVGAAFYGTAGDQWNEVVSFGGSTGATSLFDVNGSGTTVTVNLTANGSVLSLITDTQPLPALTNYYAFNNMGGTVEADIAGLNPNSFYNLALYVSSDDGLAGVRALVGTVNGVNPFAASGSPQATFVNGENMVLLSVESDASGGLDIVEANPGNASGEIDFNGFQIQQATPEPFSLSVLGLGALALIRRRRRA
jgi:MYXO-CTERM domain-containing protein